MARGKNGSTNGHASKGTGAERLDKLPDIAARIDSAKSKSDEARSDLGHIYQQAEEDGFHRRALKEAVRLRNMEPDKRNDYLASLNAYCEKLGIWAQGNLFDDEPRPPAPASGDVDAEPTAEELAESTANATEEIAGYTHETGRQAGLAGKSADDNPWPGGTKAYSSWHRGWLAGQEELVNSTVGKGERKRRKPKDDGGTEAQVH